MAKEKRKRRIVRIIQACESLVLFALILFMIHYVNDIQGTARVVNYAGLVRGETQRMVKLEITGNERDDLIQQLDGYVEGIHNGSEDLQLVKIDEKNYQDEVLQLVGEWELLKEEIYKGRVQGYENTQIISMSEAYFQRSDDVVALAEDYSQNCATTIRELEIAVIILIGMLLVIMVKQSVDALRIMGLNNELKEKVFWDEQTNLPNKNKCLQLLEDGALIEEDTTLFMFDLNNLKFVNDNMGHEAGDQLILEFAQQIRAGVPQPFFVGRYGGDEFIVILSGSNQPRVDDVLSGVAQLVEKQNQENPLMPVSYAVGYARSADMEACTLRVLLAVADKNMYINKKETKKFLDAYQELEFEAKHDGLTRLWNKTTAFSMIEKELASYTRETAMMLVVDIDDFKQVNDQKGHNCGDVVLVETARMLQRCFRREDIVGRFGGDEFFVFLSNVNNVDAVVAKANKLVTELKQHFRLKYQDIAITISVGLAVSNGITTAEELFHQADVALYQAKETGKNHCVMYLDEKY